MIMIKRLTIILAFFCFFLTSQYIVAQNVDSLRQALSLIDSKKNPQEALAIMNKIYDETNIVNPMAALEISASAINICDSVSHDSTLVMNWKLKLTKIYILLEKYYVALSNARECANYFSVNNDSINLANSYFYLGKIFKNLNVDEIAIKEFEIALDIFNKKKNLEGIINVNIELSDLYYNKSFEEGYKTKYLDILTQSIEKAKALPRSQSKIFLKISELYLNESKIDTALVFAKKSLAIAKKLNNKIDLGLVYFSLGNIWQNNNLDSANFYYSKALEIFIKYKYSYKICETYNSIAISYHNFEKLSQSEEYFQKALVIAEINSYSSQKLTAYGHLSDIYKTQKNLLKANEYLQLFNKELTLSYETSDKQDYAGIIINFQNEESDKEIELLQKEDALKTQMLKNKQQQVYGAAILILLLIGLAIVIFIYFERQKKINKLLQEQNHKINLQKKEIETQSKILEKATRDLLKQKDKILLQNNKIQASIKYASRIQKAMLPSKEKINKYFKDNFIVLKPKEVVSGDFYWFSPVKEQKPSLFKVEEDEYTKFIVSVADCTGHGVPGAFMSLLGDAFLNQIINIQKIISPDKILYLLHKLIRQTLQQGESENNDGMDIAMCLIDKKEKTLKFAGAKNPLVYVQNGEMQRILGDLTSIGGLQKEKERIFTLHTIDITAPTVIYMYSDGFQDQFGGKYGRKYMAKPFRELLFKNYQKDSEFQANAIIEELNNWKRKKYSQMDDITVMGIKL